jgi:hypothetical protein
MHRKDDTRRVGFFSGSLKGEGHLGYGSVDGRIILKQVNRV